MSGSDKGTALIVDIVDNQIDIPKGWIVKTRFDVGGNN